MIGAPEHRIHRFFKIGICLRLPGTSTNDTCIIHQYIHTSTEHCSSLNCVLDLLFIRHITWNNEYFSTKCREFHPCSLQFHLIACTQDKPCSLLGKFHSHC